MKIKDIDGRNSDKGLKKLFIVIRDESTNNFQEILLEITGMLLAVVITIVSYMVDREIEDLFCCYVNRSPVSAIYSRFPDKGLLFSIFCTSLTYISRNEQ